MGKHRESVAAKNQHRGSIFTPHASRGRRALGFFAFTAAAGFLMVNVIDPYSGATASPYFEVAPRDPEIARAEAQTLLSSGEYENVVTRDGYDVEVVVKPVPVADVEVADGAEPKKRAVADPGGARSVALGIIRSRGWGDEQYQCLDRLWQKESGWNVSAENRSSGAYGIPQSLPGSKMASAGADWRTNPATQIQWGLGYISGRYGSPCGAWAHSQAKNWY